MVVTVLIDHDIHWRVNDFWKRRDRPCCDESDCGDARPFYGFHFSAFRTKSSSPHRESGPCHSPIELVARTFAGSFWPFFHFAEGHYLRVLKYKLATLDAIVSGSMSDLLESTITVNLSSVNRSMTVLKPMVSPWCHIRA